MSIRDIVNGGVGKAEDAIQMIASLVVTGKDKLYHGYDGAVHGAEAGTEAVKQQAGKSEQWAESKTETIKAKLRGDL